MGSIEERLAELEATVARQQDRLDIIQLVASYGPHVDTANSLERMPPVTDLWAPGGFYDIGGFGRVTAPDGIRQNFEQFHFDLVVGGVAHVMSLPVVSLDGDGATAINYSTIFRHENGTFHPWRVSANVWKLARTSEGWRIRERHNRLLDGTDEALALLREIDTL